MTTILFVYPTLFHPQRGGVERVTELLTIELIKRNYRVIYLHNKKNAELMDYNFPTPVYFFPEESYVSQQNIDFYHSFLQDEKVDIVINQCGNFGDSILYNNTGDKSIKTISVLHSTPLLNYDYLSCDILQLKGNRFIDYCKFVGRFLLYFKIKHDYLNRRVRHFEYLFNNTDIVCLLSDKFVEQINRVYKGDKTIIRTIPNPNTFSGNWGIKEKEKNLLFVGRLSYGEKRPDRLIAIWKQLYKDFPDWKLYIVGDGPEKKRLEADAEKLERIVFVGYADPLPYYQQSSIFCLTSNFEGFGMVLVEAMSYGNVPFAFESFASVTDIIDNNRNGYLIKPFSIKDYVSQLRKLMNDDKLRINMAKEAMLSVQKFSLSNIVDRWEVLFQELLAEKDENEIVSNNI